MPNPTPLEAVVGANIARLRADRTQAALGEALGEHLGSPWSRQAVSAAEKGKRSFTAAELVALARALDASIPDLLHATGPILVGQVELDGSDLLQLATRIDPTENGWSRFLDACEHLNNAREEQNSYIVSVQRLRGTVATMPELRARIEDLLTTTFETRRAELEAWAAGRINERTRKLYEIDDAFVWANATPQMRTARDVLAEHWELTEHLFDWIPEEGDQNG
ncbi:hypothetical protein M2317_002934 [Microbacterium sp. ZKA21]|uniref:helix-turn-helix domain-containing protein n=1 Tax=Microbacterium sp. ZKA21 TaxID=3381694 RepID=UPI003D1D5F01